jgi:hypothetical protein
MLIHLPDYTTLSYSDLISATLRTDLVPVPVTLELTVNGTPNTKKQLVEGAELQVGESNLKVTLVKVQTLRTQIIKDNQTISGIAVVGILSGCLALIKPAPKAVILNDTTMAEAYRACGCKLPFGQDIPIPMFFCPKGQLPTLEIAKCLQEEAAVIRFHHGKLQAVRLDELFKQVAIAKYDASAFQRLHNPLVEQRATPAFISVNDDGSTIEGETGESKPILFRGGLTTRQAKNLEKVLITRGTIQRPLDNKLQAGQMIQVGDNQLTVLTAAHRTDTGALGGSTAMVTKAWLAEVAK